MFSCRDYYVNKKTAARNVMSSLNCFCCGLSPWETLSPDTESHQAQCVCGFTASSRCSTSLIPKNICFPLTCLSVFSVLCRAVLPAGRGGAQFERSQARRPGGPEWRWLTGSAGCQRPGSCRGTALGLRGWGLWAGYWLDHGWMSCSHRPDDPARSCPLQQSQVSHEHVLEATTKVFQFIRISTFNNYTQNI